MSIQKQVLGRCLLWFWMAFIITLPAAKAQTTKAPATKPQTTKAPANKPQAAKPQVTTAGQPLLEWASAPTLAGANEEDTRAAFAADGKRVAFLIGGRLWVHLVAATGALGAQMYASVPSQKVLSFVWAGQTLLVSRQTGDKSETVTLSFAPNVSETPALPLAAASLHLAPGGAMLAVAPQESAVKGDTHIEFYQRQKDSWTRIGAYLRAGAGGLERYWKDSTFGRPQWLYLLDWNDSGQGIFAVLPSSPKAPSPNPRDTDQQPFVPQQQLHLVLPDGTALPLSQPDQIGPYFRPNMLPMAGWIKREGMRVIPIGHQFLSEFGPLRAPRHYLMGVQPDAWQDEYKRGKGRIVAYLPDTRYALQQWEPTPGGAEWIVSDLNEGTWKSLGKGAPIITAHGWHGDRLLVRTRNQAGGLRWGVVSVSPQFIASKTGWTKAPAPRDKPDAIELKVLDFFKTPNVANFATLRPFYDDFRQQTEAGKPQEFSFYGYNYGSYIRVDPKLDRVVFFAGPDATAPIPDAPITLDKARQLALEWLQTRSPEWLRAGAPQVEPLPMDRDLNFWMRFTLVAPLPLGAPATCLVSVRASDGRINYYNEDKAEIARQWESLTRPYQGPAQQDALPFDTLRPSPDGHFLLFRWNIPRPGFPAWWKKRPVGLYLLDLQTKDAKPQLIAMGAGVPWWSPDSRRFAFAKDGFQIYDVVTRQTQMVPMPPVENLVQRLLGWKSADELLFGLHLSSNGYPPLSGMDLRVYRLAPEAKTADVKTTAKESHRFPTLWKANWSESLGEPSDLLFATPSPDGATLAVAWRKSSRGGFSPPGDPISIYLLPLNSTDAKPKLLRSESESSFSMMWIKKGLLSWSGGSAYNGVPTLALTSIQTGKPRSWQLPSPVSSDMGRLIMETTGVSGNELGFRFSNDGQTIFFAGIGMNVPLSRAALYAADADGKNVRTLVAPTEDLKP